MTHLEHSLGWIIRDNVMRCVNEKYFIWIIRKCCCVEKLSDWAGSCYHPNHCSVVSIQVNCSNWFWSWSSFNRSLNTLQSSNTQSGELFSFISGLFLIKISIIMFFRRKCQTFWSKVHLQQGAVVEVINSVKSCCCCYCCIFQILTHDDILIMPLHNRSQPR